MKSKLLLLILCCSLSLFAQDRLTPTQALAMAMEHNYGLRIAKLDVSAAAVNARPGNAGLLPTVDLNAGASYANSQIGQTFAGAIPEIDTTNENTAYNAQLALNYTLFDGLGNVYRLQRSKAGRGLSRIQERVIIENTLVQVMGAYLEAARTAENLDIIRDNLARSNERLKLVNYQYDFGSAGKVDVLNAEVDLNNDSILFQNTLLQYETAFRKLSQLLGGELAEGTQLAPEVEFGALGESDGIVADALEYNRELQAQRQQMDIARFDLRIAQAGWFPRLDGNLGYGYNRSANTAGFSLVNDNLSFSAGLNLSFNIFNGLQTRNQVQLARIDIASNQLRMQELELQVENEVRNAYSQFNNSLKVLEYQSTGIETAELNLDRSREAYRLGQINSTQLRDAQLNLLNARLTETNARFDAKLAEMELLRAAGQLIQE